MSFPETQPTQFYFLLTDLGLPAIQTHSWREGERSGEASILPPPPTDLQTLTAPVRTMFMYPCACSTVLAIVHAWMLE